MPSRRDKHLVTNSRITELGTPAYNPRHHDLLYSAIEAGLWLVAETQLVFAYPTALHEHDVVQIMAMIDGGMRFHDPSGACEMGVGDVVIIPAEHPHRGGAHSLTSRCRMLDIRLEVPSGSPLAYMLDRLHGRMHHHAGKDRLCLLRDQLRHALEQSEPQRLAEVMTVIWSLFAACVQSTARDGAVTPSAASHDARLAIAESYIREHLHKPIDLPTLAEVTHLSVSQLARLYRRHMHTTPARRIETLKMKRGYELLIGGTQSVKEIAASCGFQGTAQFTRAFRRTFGRTPSDARTSIVTSEAS